MMEHLGRLRKPLLVAPLIIEFVLFNSTFTSMEARGQRRIFTQVAPFCSTIIVSKYAIAETNFQGDSVIMCEDLDGTQCVENPTNE